MLICIIYASFMNTSMSNRLTYVFVPYLNFYKICEILQKWRISWPAEQILTSQEEIFSTELVNIK